MSKETVNAVLESLVLYGARLLASGTSPQWTAMARISGTKVDLYRGKVRRYLAKNPDMQKDTPYPSPKMLTALLQERLAAAVVAPSYQKPGSEEERQETLTSTANTPGTEQQTTSPEGRSWVKCAPVPPVPTATLVKKVNQDIQEKVSGDDVRGKEEQVEAKPFFPSSALDQMKK